MLHPSSESVKLLPKPAGDSKPVTFTVVGKVPGGQPPVCEKNATSQITFRTCLDREGLWPCRSPKSARPRRSWQALRSLHTDCALTAGRSPWSGFPLRSRSPLQARQLPGQGNGGRESATCAQDGRDQDDSRYLRLRKVSHRYESQP